MVKMNNKIRVPIKVVIGDSEMDDFKVGQVVLVETEAAKVLKALEDNRYKVIFILTKEIRIVDGLYMTAY